MKYVYLLILSILLVGCSSIFNSNEYEPKDTDVIHAHGRIENVEHLDRFVESVQNKKKDQVRIVQYTIEGDPILTELTYDGNSIEYKYDTTRDKFGSGSISTKQCTNIIKNVSSTETIYNLQCENNAEPEEIFYIEHDISKQDYFGFDFTYGKDKKVRINTKEQFITIESNNGETVTANDIQLPTEELNKIYKAMVYANYLDEKDLTWKCSKTPEFTLKVWINQGEKTYQWSECDHSKEGKQMTKMAKKIIEIIEQSTIYKKLRHS
jgi:hypothetical protein